MADSKTVPRIPPADPGSADPATASLLRARERKWGKPWNVVHTIANAPAVLKMMDQVWDCLAESSLSPLDREVIAMEMAATNGCHYCVPAHRFVARREARLDSLSLSLLERVAQGEELPEGTRMAVMQRLVRRLLSTRGALTDAEFAAFSSEGVTPQQMIETIAEIAHCTVTNFTNRLARTAVDSFLEPYCTRQTRHSP